MDEYNNQFSAPGEGEYTAPTSAEYAESYVTPYEEETAPNKTMGIISMICAIAGVVIYLIGWCASFLLPCASTCTSVVAFGLLVAAIVLAIVDKKKNNGTMTAMAKVGMIIGIVALVLGLIITIVGLIIAIATIGFSGLMSMAEGMGSSSSYYYY